jgi:branched-subunit amino acid aminotransferase/4-amino-4-deoxychorismate lyase
MPISVFRLDARAILPLKTDAASPDELTRELPRGLYTTFSTNTNGTRVLGLSAHLDRLYVPAQAEGIRPSASRADLRLALAKLALDSAPGESRFRLLLSASDGTVRVIVQPFTPLAKEIYEHGVKVVTAHLVRRDPRRKDSGFIAESQSARTRVGGDVFEVLLTRNGKIYEGMTSNFYAVLPPVIARRPERSEATLAPHCVWCSAGESKADEAISLSARGLLCREERPPRNDGMTLVTARTGILLGVTRRAVLRLARGQGMSILYRAPRLALRDEFAEAFLTSSSRGIVPIISIDGRGVGEGTVGAWTERLMNAYQSYVEERGEEIGSLS